MNKHILKYFRKDHSIKEQALFLREISENDILKKEYAHCRNIISLINLASNEKDEIEGKNSYNTFIKEKNKKKYQKRILSFTTYAALITLLIISTWYVSIYYNTNGRDNEIAYNTVIVPAGQRASVRLSDGTQVWLNAKSMLRYPSSFEGGIRNVEIRGEAYFEVAKNRDMPFIVSTSSVDVKVLGTTFNIRDYEDMKETDVCLLEGAVEVTVPHDTTKVRLKPMQGARYINQKMTLISDINTNDFLWREGLYNFEHAPLSDIAQKLELYYDVKIIITNPIIARYRYSGKFRQQDGVYEILRIIKQIHKFSIEKNEENNTYILR